MPLRTPASSSPLPTGPRRSPSWMDLLAVTTLGVRSAGTVTARVRVVDALRPGRKYRLIVQSYDGNLTYADNPEGGAIFCVELPADAEGAAS